MAKKSVHVVQSGNSWAVKPEGTAKPVSTHRTQKTASDAGRKLAKQNESELVIHQPFRDSRKGRSRRDGSAPSGRSRSTASVSTVPFVMMTGQSLELPCRPFRDRILNPLVRPSTDDFGCGMPAPDSGRSRWLGSIPGEWPVVKNRPPSRPRRWPLALRISRRECVESYSCSCMEVLVTSTC